AAAFCDSGDELREAQMAPRAPPDRRQRPAVAVIPSPATRIMRSMAVSPEKPAAGDPDPTTAAHHIVSSFALYNAEFRAITRRAPRRFDERDWQGSQRDSVERIELYDRYVNRT